MKIKRTESTELNNGLCNWKINIFAKIKNQHSYINKHSGKDTCHCKTPGLNDHSRLN